MLRDHQRFEGEKVDFNHGHWRGTGEGGEEGGSRSSLSFLGKGPKPYDGGRPQFILKDKESPQNSLRHENDMKGLVS